MTTSTLPLIRSRFYSRSTGKQLDAVAMPTTLNYNTDMRLGAGTFDFEIGLSLTDLAELNSHDFVEFAFPFNGGNEGYHQIGVGYLEDFLRHTGPTQMTLKANGRDLFGQSISIPFKRQIIQQMSLVSLVQATFDGDTYLRQYCKLRGRIPVVDSGAYTGLLQVFTVNTQMRGAILAEKAELAQNIVYMNRLGQAEIYGRLSRDSKVMGKLYKSRSGSNVDDIAIRSNYSKVLSECTVEFSGEENLSDYLLKSRTFKNTDSRVAHIYQPKFHQFTNPDVAAFVGQLGPAVRAEMIAKSEIRRSNQGLNQTAVLTSYPYFVDPLSGIETPYVVGQRWHILSENDGLDRPMKLAGISYTQDASHLSVQLAFVEPDTLV